MAPSVKLPQPEIQKPVSSTSKTADAQTLLENERLNLINMKRELVQRETERTIKELQKV